jgi:hypothetical protein
MNAIHPLLRPVGLATAVLALVGADPARDPRAPADGDPLILGQENTSENTTRIVAGEIALWGVSDTDDGALVGESVSSDGYGVRGTSPYIGVNAIGGEIGVYAVSDYGTGVEGLTYDGVAVRASTAVEAGTALKVEGRAEFRWSGQVVIPQGTTRVTVDDVPLTEHSLVLANLQEWFHGLHLEAAVPDVAGRSFTLHLNRKAPRTMVAAWFVVD